MSGDHARITNKAAQVGGFRIDNYLLKAFFCLFLGVLSFARPAEWFVTASLLFAVLTSLTAGLLSTRPTLRSQLLAMSALCILLAGVVVSYSNWSWWHLPGAYLLFLVSGLHFVSSRPAESVWSQLRALAYLMAMSAVLLIMLEIPQWYLNH